MKTFKIATPTGYFALPMKFKSITFPPTTAAKVQHATEFPFRSAALYIKRKYKLTKAFILEFDFTSGALVNQKPLAPVEPHESIKPFCALEK